MFRKYSFTNETEANTYIDGLGVDEEGNPSHSHSIVRLGNIVLTEGEYDEEGEVITEPVLSNNYHVDVLWQGDALSSWDSKMVWCPPMGVHTFGSSRAIAEWTEKCKELHPEYFPEPNETDV